MGVGSGNTFCIELDEFQQLECSRFGGGTIGHAVGAGDINELFTYPKDRIEGIEGGLEDHRALVPPVVPERIGANAQDINRTAITLVDNRAISHLGSAHE